MATKPLDQIETNIRGTKCYRWAGMATGDKGAFLKLPNHSDKCVTFGAVGGNDFGGATHSMEGSNDPACETDPANAVCFPLTDGGSAVSATSAKGFQIDEDPLYIRPTATGGAAGDVDVIVTCKRG